MPLHVLENRVNMIQTAQLMNVVVIAQNQKVLVNVLLLVLENRVNIVHTAHLMNIVVV